MQFISYEYTSAVVVYFDCPEDGPERKIPRVVVWEFQRKAWHFVWENPEKMFDEMTEHYNRVSRTLREAPMQVKGEEGWLRLARYGTVA